jgi:hypothetical protein
VQRTRRTLLVAGALTLWLAAMAAAALSGSLARFDLRPPPLGIWFFSTGLLAVFAARSQIGRRVALALPLSALVGFQAFRLPLELVMHRAASDGVMPNVMSFTGYNFDIVTGASAALLFPWLLLGKAPLGLVRAWNYLGLTLLAIVASVAFAATPLFHAFGPAELNTWVAHFPYCWMAVMVASALCGHLLIARRLTHEARLLAAGSRVALAT